VKSPPLAPPPPPVGVVGVTVLLESWRLCSCERRRVNVFPGRAAAVPVSLEGAGGSPSAGLTDGDEGGDATRRRFVLVLFDDLTVNVSLSNS